MTTTRLGTLAVLASLVAACGEGRAILNIDILSFYPDGRLDTAYVAPGGGSSAVLLLPVSVSTVALGGSVVDTVLVTVAADVENTQGAGSVAFEVFFAESVTTVFDPANRVATDTAVVNGVETVALDPLPFLVSDPSLFARDEWWVGVRVTASANIGLALTGRFRFRTFGARIVVQDELTP